MPEHVKPYVYETLNTKALHFSISEIQSRMQTQRPDALDLDYTRTMMGMLLFNGQPETLAMIGLGGGSLAKFCYRHLPTTRIQVVEINPHVIALRDEFRVPPDDGRFQVRRGDGADFVRFPPHLVDVLMVDGFDSTGQPPALCSQQFYDDCYDALEPDGLLVVNLHADPRSAGTLAGRIRRSFDEEVVVVEDVDGGNNIVFACKGALMRRFNSALLRKPRHFDAAAWDDLMPAFTAVDQAVNQWRAATAA
ncbi:transferase [Pelomonas cellulosilytica]|uniref:Transferase n=1 Tax=Pelomonas cellulosilytica TaxID=2906762 RepID=A0ABS8XPA7_9BURK|nr:transferase [Pelomonas sp. P8]MCE4554582.1 transferase [Pelomonas sp. P8]